MVLHHSVSPSSENSHSRTQTVEEGRCVDVQRHVGMRQSWILETTGDMPASCSPSQVTENENIQRNSIDIYNKQLIYGLIIYMYC